MEHLYTQTIEPLVVIITGIVLLAIELLYFRVAEHYAIIDKPNNRSSHTGSVIRGGGIVFFVALVGWFGYSSLSWPHFMIGAAMVALISFLDDIRPQNSLVRFSVHMIAVLLLFYSAQIYDWPIWLIVLASIVCIGTINAFNFMDGINGITGIYALVNLACFTYVQLVVIPFTSLTLLLMVGIAVLIFLFFNFRAKAKCFAGDVGSVTLAFIQIFLLVQLIVVTNNFLWVIMFLVYGIDSVVTILYRLKNKENIFKAHRTHLYQYMSNELKWQHRSVAVLYGAVQLVLNVILIASFHEPTILIPIISSIAFILGYLMVRKEVLNKIKRQSVSR